MLTFVQFIQYYVDVDRLRAGATLGRIENYRVVVALHYAVQP